VSLELITLLYKIRKLSFLKEDKAIFVKYDIFPMTFLLLNQILKIKIEKNITYIFSYKDYIINYFVITLYYNEIVNF